MATAGLQIIPIYDTVYFLQYGICQVVLDFHGKILIHYIETVRQKLRSHLAEKQQSGGNQSPAELSEMFQTKRNRFARNLLCMPLGPN